MSKESTPTAEIPRTLYERLVALGIIDAADTRSFNVGASDYSAHVIQPWSIWLDYCLNPFDADIIKRVLRKKCGESRADDYRKIIHICQERLRQLAVSDEQSHGDEM
ncbi:MAG: hypothetical protein ACI30W_03580 [Muribaculaceae bacterium]